MYNFTHPFHVLYINSLNKNIVLAANKIRTVKQILQPLCIFFFICHLSSCSKSSHSVLYLKAKFDGTEKTFNSIPVTAQYQQDYKGHYSLVITGIDKVSASGFPVSNSEQASLTLWSDLQDFSAGKTFTTVEQNGTTPANNFWYVSAFSGLFSDNWTSTYSFSPVKESLNCTITELTNSYVKGNFSTVIYQGVDSPIVSKTVSSGEFYAKFYP
jgi:hypothetical protein